MKVIHCDRDRGTCYTQFCYKNLSVVETYCCERNFVLWQKFISVKDFFAVSRNYFCDRKLFLWQKTISVTENYFCERNLFLWQKLVSLTKIVYLTKVFLVKEISSMTETYLTAFYAWIVGKFFCEKWEFPLSRIIEILTLWCHAYKGMA